MLNLGALVLFTVAIAAPAAAAPIEGLWWVEAHEAHVEITETGGEVSGRIVWLEDPTYPSSEPKRDRQNPDPDLRGHPIIGLTVLDGFRPHRRRDNVWVGGTFYNPHDGRAYSCILTLKNANTLHVRGYIGVPFIGRTYVSTRVSSDAHSDHDGVVEEPN